MKRGACAVLAVLFVLGIGCAAWASVVEDDAKALAEKGAAHVKAVGKEKGTADIMDPKGEFKKGKLFLTLNDFSGVLLANPAFPGLVGQNHWNLKDPNGKYFIREAAEIAKTKGSGWLEYSFTNPDTKKIGPRKGWIQRVEGTDMFIMAPIVDK